MWYRLKSGAKIKRQLSIFLSSIFPSIHLKYIFFFFSFKFILFLNFFLFLSWVAAHLEMSLNNHRITCITPKSIENMNPLFRAIFQGFAEGRGKPKPSALAWGPAQCLRVAPAAVGRTWGWESNPKSVTTKIPACDGRALEIPAVLCSITRQAAKPTAF